MTISDGATYVVVAHIICISYGRRYMRLSEHD